MHSARFCWLTQSEWCEGAAISLLVIAGSDLGFSEPYSELGLSDPVLLSAAFKSFCTVKTRPLEEVSERKRQETEYSFSEADERQRGASPVQVKGYLENGDSSRDKICTCQLCWSLVCNIAFMCTCWTSEQNGNVAGFSKRGTDN